MNQILISVDSNHNNYNSRNSILLISILSFFMIMKYDNEISYYDNLQKEKTKCKTENENLKVNVNVEKNDNIHDQSQMIKFKISKQPNTTVENNSTTQLAHHKIHT